MREFILVETHSSRRDMRLHRGENPKLEMHKLKSLDKIKVQQIISSNYLSTSLLQPARPLSMREYGGKGYFPSEVFRGLQISVLKQEIQQNPSHNFCNQGFLVLNIFRIQGILSFSCFKTLLDYSG